MTESGQVRQNELERIRRTLMHIAVARLPQVADAEEVVQDALQALIVRLAEAEPEQSRLQYAVGILRHKITDFYRQAAKSRSEELTDSFPIPARLDEEMYLTELQDEIRRIVRRMPARCRELLGHLYQGRTPREMLDHVEAPSLAALKMQVSRCRKGLKQMLARAGFPVGGGGRLPPDADQCVYPEIGRLLPLYEADLLELEKKECFEEHLAECPSCAVDLYDFSDVAGFLREHCEVFREDEKARPQKAAFQHRTDLVERVFLALILTGVILDYGGLAAEQMLSHLGYEAREVFDVPLPTYPPSVFVDLDRGLLVEGREQYLSREFAKAQPLLEKSVRLNPKLPEAHFFLGINSLYLGKNERARFHLARGQLSGKDREISLHFLALAYWRLGDTERTVGILDDLVAMRGERAPFANNWRKKIRRLGSVN